MTDPHAKERQTYGEIMMHPEHYFPDETPENLKTLGQAATDLFFALPPTPTQVYPVPNNFHVSREKCTSKFGCPCDFCRDEQWKSEENDLAREFIKRFTSSPRPGC